MIIAIEFLVGTLLSGIGKLAEVLYSSTFNWIEIATYIMVGTNIIMILLMLATILYTQKSTRKHVFVE